MQDILDQAERLYTSARTISRQNRVKGIADRYLLNTAKANKVDADEVIKKSVYDRMEGFDTAASRISATRRQRMGLSNG